MRHLVLLLAIVSCAAPVARDAGTDSLGASPRDVRRVRVLGHVDLVENSAAAMSRTQPGVFFTINDSDNDPVLFALDTTGSNRGAWRVQGAKNHDWEAASVGPCGADAPPARHWCVYIGDVGDNGEARRQVAIYRVAEPIANRRIIADTITAARLRFRYADGPHDVEAIYVAPNGSVVLITKRPRAAVDGHLRPALVFALDAGLWTRAADSLFVAPLVDSLPIVPGTALTRAITDAALAPDGQHLAVRTYGQVYVFATDSITGRVRHEVPPAICDLDGVEEEAGEGITWVGHDRLLLTSEGRWAAMHLVTCPLSPGAFPATTGR